MELITADELRKALAYNAETGVFTWVAPTSNRVQAGSAAGSVTSYGYLSIRINGRAYQAHRLAWLHIHGRWPDGEIDHRNGVRHDNRGANLRDVSGRVNRQNIRRARCTSFSGLLGVHWDPRARKWVARITAQHRQIFLGQFMDKLAAHECYLNAKRELHEGCTL